MVQARASLKGSSPPEKLLRALLPHDRIARINPTTDYNNIDIGNYGAAEEANTIRIGIQGVQTKTFHRKVFGTPVTEDAVVVRSSGQFGSVVSSALGGERRFRHMSNGQCYRVPRPPAV
jgi:hypothetical protein